MIALGVRRLGETPQTPTRARRRFGLDAPLPADKRMVERALLRHLAQCRPAILPLAFVDDHAKNNTVSVEAGVPDLMLLAPGGRVIFVKIKTQAEDLTRAHRAFADLCRERGIPLVVVRSLPEARRALDELAL